MPELMYMPTGEPGNRGFLLVVDVVPKERGHLNPPTLHGRHSVVSGVPPTPRKNDDVDDRRQPHGPQDAPRAPQG